MNVCIKCGRCPLALETYHKMRQDGCAPNVVTFNTLIDVYGKMGQWEQAVKVLSIMKGEVRVSSLLSCPPPVAWLLSICIPADVMWQFKWHVEGIGW